MEVEEEIGGRDLKIELAEKLFKRAKPVQRTVFLYGLEITHL